MYQPFTACNDPTLLGLAKNYLSYQDAAHLTYLPALEEQRVAVPARLRIGPARKLIAADPRFKDGVRTHHAVANKIIEAGQNPILTTGTGSGKSIVFMTEALQTILSDPHARVLVFYPTRALNADQLYKWREMLAYQGLPASTVASIDGSVNIGERPGLLRDGRIIITTPDAFHSWFMSNIDNPDIARFIGNIQMKILEEVQLYSGAFGTSMMYLMRRIDMAQQWLNPAYKREKNGRMIATSATIADAPAFMKRLTGQTFVEVGDEHNGASRHPRLIAVTPWHTGTVKANAARMAEENPDKKILIFCDSRYGVEEIANELGDMAVPYKSGMSGAFQREVEQSIRSGKKKIVVATSSLEVGVDLDFDIAYNIGLPGNAGSALQRIGRVGRHTAGLFIFADHNRMLEDYGDDVTRYLTSEIPAQTLYPGNQFIQMAQGMCLRRERHKVQEAVGPKQAPAITYKGSGIVWPQGFGDAMKRIEENPAQWPWHYRTLVPPRGSTPHMFHSMRNVGGISWRISRWDPIRKEYFQNLGTTQATNAFLEFPPGAIVRHQKKKWRVKRWTSDKWGQPIIQLDEYDGENSTKHKLVRFGMATAANDGLISDAILSEEAKEGQDPIFVGECRFRLHVGLYSFNENYKTEDGHWRTRTIRYQDDEELANKDPENFDGSFVDYGPKRRMLIDTTGMIVHMPTHRFGRDARDTLAQALIDDYCDLHNIDRSDIGYISDRCRFMDRAGKPRDSGNMAIFDRTAGSLRLTQHFPRSLKRVLGRIIKRSTALKGTPMTPHEKMKNEYLIETAEWFLDKLKALDIKRADKLDASLAAVEEKLEKIDSTLPEGYIRVIAPGSQAEWARGGIAQRVRIIEPKTYEGAVMYEVLAIDRSAFYARARARKLEKSDAFGFESDEKPYWADDTSKPLDASRAIPEANIILSAGRYVGYNPQTQKYIELDNEGTYEDISITVEKQMAAMREKMKLMREQAEERKKQAQAAGFASARAQSAARRAAEPPKPTRRPLKPGARPGPK